MFIILIFFILGDIHCEDGEIKYDVDLSGFDLQFDDSDLVLELNPRTSTIINKSLGKLDIKGEVESGLVVNILREVQPFIYFNSGTLQTSDSTMSEDFAVAGVTSPCITNTEVEVETKGYNIVAKMKLDFVSGFSWNHFVAFHNETSSLGISYQSKYDEYTKSVRDDILARIRGRIILNSRQEIVSVIEGLKQHLVNIR